MCDALIICLLKIISFFPTITASMRQGGHKKAIP